MKNLVTGAMAALTLGSAAIAGPASARGGYGYHDDGAGAAIAGGLFGFALGAAIASSSHPAYYGAPGPYYGGPYYGPAYYGPAYGYGSCIGRRTVWDPYWGRYRVRTFRYAC